MFWTSLRRRLPALAAALALAPAAVAGEPPDHVGAALVDLHHGLYERAEAGFRAASRAAPDDPQPHLLVAFVYWLRFLDDRSATERDVPFRAAIDEVVARGERRLALGPGDAATLSSLGTAHIFLFHLEAVRKNHRRAAQDARRGKKLLEEALLLDPAGPDPLFALGAYNYYASQIPALARGLAAFLGLPGGNRALGLEQLRQVAGSRSLFRVSGRLLLASICGARDERCYEQAIRHLDRALDDAPGSALVLGSRGSLELRIGDHAAAARSFEAALRAAAGADPGRLRQQRALGLLLAEALVAGWRLEEAEAALAAPGSGREGLSARERRTLERLEEELSIKKRESEVRAALRAEDEPGRNRALAGLRRAAESRPGEPLLHLVMGRLLRLLGRPEEAAPELDRASAVADLAPPWVQGWLELEQGLLQRALGRPRAARAHFKRASEVRRFRSADQALLELARDEGMPGRTVGCEP